MCIERIMAFGVGFIAILVVLILAVYTYNRSRRKLVVDRIKSSKERKMKYGSVDKKD